jgi:cysteine synthase
MMELIKARPNENALRAIGNTPLVKLNELARGLNASIYVKLEYFNPTGSMKDRMALAMIEGAEKEGLLKKGDTVIEYTGGSTGSSLAFVCAVKGYKLKIVSSDAFSLEKLNTMKAFGAELTIVHSQGGKITPDLIPRMMQVAEEMAKEPRTFQTDQFHNRNSLLGYNQLGAEILEQLDGNIDAFVMAFGTAGCAMGVAEVLKRKSKDIRIVLVEPKEAPLVSKGTKGTHHIEGIGVGFIPPLLTKELYDEIATVSTADAQEMARRLTKEEGIFSGTSTGANVKAALELAKKLGSGKNIVTVAIDSGLKYLSTELYNFRS